MKTLKNKVRNQVNVIYPYRTESGIWCFDDEEVSLQAEPFVGEVNSMLDQFAKGRKKLVIYISKSYLPNETLILDKVVEDIEGVYRLRGTYQFGWLCPAMLKYFSKYPKEIHCKIEDYKFERIWSFFDSLFKLKNIFQ